GAEAMAWWSVAPISDYPRPVRSERRCTACPQWQTKSGTLVQRCPGASATGPCRSSRHGPEVAAEVARECKARPRRENGREEGRALLDAPHFAHGAQLVVQQCTHDSSSDRPQSR